MDDADEVERSLAAARELLLPPAGAQERVLARVASRRALELGGTRAPITGAARKLVSTTVLIGTGFIAGYWLGRHDSSVASDAVSAAPTTAAAAASSGTAEPTATAAGAPPPPASSASSPPATHEPSAPATPAGELAQRSVPAPPSVPEARPPRPRSPAAGKAQLARRARASTAPPLDELTLLSRVERALRAGEAALALALLDELERHHPSSTLSEERTAARLLADCMLDAPSARERAARFLRVQRASVYSDRLRGTCALTAGEEGRARAEGEAGER